jgi:hypothetical protein
VIPAKLRCCPLLEIWQWRLIEKVKEDIPKISGKGVMKIFRNKFNFTAEPTNHSHDSLHHINLEQLDVQLEAWGLKEREKPVRLELSGAVEQDKNGLMDTSTPSPDMVLQTVTNSKKV